MPNLVMVSFQRLYSPDRPLMSLSASLALLAVFSACAMALFLSSVACTAEFLIVSYLPVIPAGRDAVNVTNFEQPG